MKTLQLFCLAAFIILLSCNSDDDNSQNNESQPIPILGEWKLVSIEYFAHGYEIVDYSNDNIIFDFKLNNVLIVSGNDDPSHVYISGEYDYIFEEIQDDDPNNCPIEVTIDLNNFCFSHDDDNMTISQADIDGPFYSFIRN